MSTATKSTLPPISAKRYFTIGEVADLCLVKPHVLRYWEQEFSQLRPIKRRGNRRYYQHHEVVMARRIRDLLYDQGFTISGARNFLNTGTAPPPQEVTQHEQTSSDDQAMWDATASSYSIESLRAELHQLQQILMLATVPKD